MNARKEAAVAARTAVVPLCHITRHHLRSQLEAMVSRPQRVYGQATIVHRRSPGVTIAFDRLASGWLMDSPSSSVFWTPNVIVPRQTSVTLRADEPSCRSGSVLATPFAAILSRLSRALVLIDLASFHREEWLRPALHAGHRTRPPAAPAARLSIIATRPVSSPRGKATSSSAAPRRRRRRPRRRARRRWPLIQRRQVAAAAAEVAAEAVVEVARCRSLSPCGAIMLNAVAEAAAEVVGTPPSSPAPGGTGASASRTSAA